MINLPVQKLSHDKNNMNGLSKDYFRQMLTVTMTGVLFYMITNMSSNIMEFRCSPLRTGLANIFLCAREILWAEKFPPKKSN